MGINLFVYIPVIILVIVSIPVVLNYYLIKKKSLKTNFKVLSTHILAIVVWIIIWANIFVPTFKEHDNYKLDVVIFIASITIGIFLIRSILRELEIESTVESLIKKLNDNNIKLSKLEQQKTEFISMASHQLRGPLSSIMGYVSMMLEGDYGNVPEGIQLPLNRIFRSGNSLAILINDFLSINRIEKGEMDYVIEDFDINLVIKSLMPDFRMLSKEKNLLISRQCDIKGALMVRGDVAKMRQIISNVLDNAIKYTKEGSIKIICGEANGNAIIKVQDTGIGINKDLGQKIFKKFVRDKEAVKIDVEGTGIGLFIASNMLHAMDGNIWAESAGFNKGATFFIKIPLSKV